MRRNGLCSRSVLSRRALHGKGAYKTPIKVKGEKYYRKAVTVTSDRPPTRLADVYGSWATSENNASW